MALTNMDLKTKIGLMFWGRRETVEREEQKERRREEEEEEGKKRRRKIKLRYGN